jgi:hypothetical protein
LTIVLTGPENHHSSWNFAAAFVRTWKTLRYRIGELRTFRRFARRLKFTQTEGPGLRVILYGIPYGDWNAMLADADLWQSLKRVSEVRRIPAFGFLVPRGDDRTVVIPMKAEHAALVPEGSHGLLPDKRALEALGDKQQFGAYVAENGLAAHCPATYSSPDEASFPCVVKRLDLSGSVGVEVANSRDELQTILRSKIFAGRPYFLQAAVPSPVEYASFCICDGGRLLWHWTFASTMTGPLVIKSEETDKNRQTVEMPAGVQEQIEHVLAPLAYRGPCVVNYKLDANGRARIFEINPRFGGSLLQRPQVELLREALGHLLDAAR